MNNRRLEGIGGWLIVVAIAIIVRPIITVFDITAAYTDIFATEIWEMLTTPGSEAYHFLWAPLIIGELAYNLLFITALFYLAFLFFTKNRLFPKVFILLTSIHLVFMILDSLVVVSFVDVSLFDPEIMRDILQAALAAAIWIPYMLRSERVKNTFRDKRFDRLDPNRESAPKPLHYQVH